MRPDRRFGARDGRSWRRRPGWRWRASLATVRGQGVEVPEPVDPKGHVPAMSSPWRSPAQTMATAGARTAWPRSGTFVDAQKLAARLAHRVRPDRARRQGPGRGRLARRQDRRHRRARTGRSGSGTRAKGGAPLATLEGRHSGPVEALAFSPRWEDARLGRARHDSSGSGTSTRRRCSRGPSQGHEQGVRGLAFSARRQGSRLGQPRPLGQALERARGRPSGRPSVGTTPPPGVGGLRPRRRDRRLGRARQDGSALAGRRSGRRNRS